MNKIQFKHVFRTLGNNVANFISKQWSRLTNIFRNTVHTVNKVAFRPHFATLKKRKIKVLTPKTEAVKKFNDLLKKVMNDEELSDQEWEKFEKLVTSKNSTPELEEKMLSDWVTVVPDRVRQKIIDIKDSRNK